MENRDKVNITGTITTPPAINSDFGQDHLIMYISVPRLSKTMDTIPVLLPEGSNGDYPQGMYVRVSGQYRANFTPKSEKRKLHQAVIAQEVKCVDKTAEPCNSICLDGYICKAPINRTTPGGRIITDLLVAVNHSSKASSYIPCICWGSVATRIAEECAVGDHIYLRGRIQSRLYSKQVEEGVYEDRIAYEVSAYSVKKISVEDHAKNGTPEEKAYA